MKPAPLVVYAVLRRADKAPVGMFFARNMARMALQMHLYGDEKDFAIRRATLTLFEK